jgi:Ftsk gamma domain
MPDHHQPAGLFIHTEINTMTDETETTPPKRPPFKLSGVATIKHLNVRKEGPEDEKVLAVDIKLEFQKIDRAICDYFDDAMSLFLWRHETSGLIVRNAFLHPVEYMNQITSASVTIEGQPFHSCEVKKFAISPRDGGQVDLTCSVSIYPSSSDVADLAKRVQDGATVLIEGPPDLFDGDAGAAAAGSNTIITFTGANQPDELLEQARAIVVTEQKASISLVQRKLKIGYNRAARLLESLEALGVVSVMSSAGVRDVLVKDVA